MAWNALWTILGVMLVFLALGVPISYSIGISSLAAILATVSADAAVVTAAQRIFVGMSRFSLTAIPFFILAGNIMNKGGIAIRLINFAKLFTGSIPGALAHTNAVANMLFGAISGSGTAAASAMGSIIGPIEEEEGYDRDFSAAANIATAPTGLLIPPSNVMITYSLVSGGTSVAALFMAGYIPGILWGLACMAVIFYFAKKKGYRSTKKYSNSEKVKVFFQAIPCLLMIVIVIGGIISGIFTATEGSVVAVVYSLIISLFVYKDMSFKELPQVFVEGAVSTATIMVMVGLSSASSYVITTSGLPQQLVSFFSSITNSPVVILLLLNILFLIIGMLMEANAAVVMMTPILLPLLNAFGIDLLQFGIVMSFNLCIGLVTPPVGLCLLLCNQTGETRLSHSLKAMMPMLLISIIVLFLITYVSPLTTLLPSIMAG